jgi:hypothetical protein
MIPFTIYKYLIMFKPVKSETYEYNIFVVSNVWFSVGIISWILERIYCNMFIEMFGFYFLQLHSVWHICMGNALWGYFIVAFMKRCRKENRDVKIKPYYHLHCLEIV